MQVASSYKELNMEVDHNLIISPHKEWTDEAQIRGLAILKAIVLCIPKPTTDRIPTISINGNASHIWRWDREIVQVLVCNKVVASKKVGNQD